jgi:hypothetical protein
VTPVTPPTTCVFASVTCVVHEARECARASGLREPEMAVKGVSRRERISCIIRCSFPLNACPPPPYLGSCSQEQNEDSPSSDTDGAGSCHPATYLEGTWRPRPRELLVLDDVTSSSRPASRGAGLKLSRGLRLCSVRHCDPAPSLPLATLLHDNSLPSRAVRRHGAHSSESAGSSLLSSLASCAWPAGPVLSVKSRDQMRGLRVWRTKRAYRSGRNRRWQGGIGVPGLSSLKSFTSRHWPRGSKKYHFLRIHPGCPCPARSCSRAVITC